MSGNTFVEAIAQMDGVETVSAMLFNKGQSLRFQVTSKNLDKINKGSEVYKAAEQLVAHLINHCGWTLEKMSCYEQNELHYNQIFAEFIRE